jgi:PAS domain S-box-containing protein
MTRRSAKKKASMLAPTNQPANKMESLERAAGALKESELKYRTLVEMIPAVTYLASPFNPAELIFLAPQIKDLLGYSPEEWLTTPKNWSRQLHPQDRPRLIKAARHSVKTGAPFIQEYRLLTRDGRTLWVYDQAYLLKDPSGNPLYFQGIVQDITVRKKAEERYRQVVENADEAIWVIQDDRIRFANPKSEEISGYSIQEETTRPFLDFIHPDDRTMIQNNYLRRLKGQKSPDRYELRFLRKNGDIRFLRLNLKLITWENRPASLVFATDITKSKEAQALLRESQERYRSLIEATDTGFFILDEKGRVMDANLKYVRLTGHRRLKEIIGRGVEEWAEENERDKNLAAVRECFRRGFIRGLEISYRDPRGQRTSVEINATVVKGPEGPRIFSLVQDITQRKATELALKASRRQLRNLSEHLQTILEKERIEISRRIHDDLGQQLTAMKMDMFWLNQRLSPDQPALSEKIKSISRLIDGTIQTIQKISRELRPPLLEHLGLTAALEWQLKDFQKRTGLEGSLTISPRKLTLDQEDSTLIFRLVQEMLTNIIRHAEAQAVKITLKKNENQVVLTVSDNGLGITPDRINDPRSLGLIGMRERVYARDGTIQIRGLPQGGTKIAVELSLNRRGNRHDKNISRR